MLGNITFDKSSMVLSYFLYSVWLIKEHGGRISRTVFEEKMASFIGVSIKNEDGTINRTPYNKSKFPRYFGFICSEYEGENKDEFLVLTFRGQELSSIIGQRQNVNAVDRYCVTDRNKFKSLILYSLLFDSFGKNNYGAEQSNTDVEPPKIVFKTIYELGHASAKEIFFIIFGLNGYPKKNKRPLFDSFEEAISDVRAKRDIGFNYDSWIQSWELKNFVNDCKIVKIFSEKGFGLVSSNLNEQTGELEYSLAEDLNSDDISFICQMKPVYQPLLHIQESEADISFIQEWMNVAVYGKGNIDETVFRINAREIHNTLLENETFLLALLSAYQNPKKAVYVEFVDASLEDMSNLFKDCEALLDRIDDVQDVLNGWSKTGVSSIPLYQRILKVGPNKIQGMKVQDVLSPGTIRLPSNFNVTGVKSYGN